MDIQEGSPCLFFLFQIIFLNLFFSSRISDQFIFNLCHKDHAVGDQQCSRYSYHDIKEIHLMRFLLQVGIHMLSHFRESCNISNDMRLKTTCSVFTKTTDIFLLEYQNAFCPIIASLAFANMTSFLYPPKCLNTLTEVAGWLVVGLTVSFTQCVLKLDLKLMFFIFMEVTSKWLTSSNTQLPKTSVVVASVYYGLLTHLSWASWNNFQVMHVVQ